jgi:hypothetical protein
MDIRGWFRHFDINMNDSARTSVTDGRFAAATGCCVGRRLLPALVLGALVALAGCGRGRDPSAGRPSEPSAAPHPGRDYAGMITVEELKEHVGFLASADLQGRHSGTPGAAKAAEYLSGLFEELGLRGPGEADEAYLQNFAMTVKTPVSCYLESDHGRADNWTDFMELHSDFAGRRTIELVFARYGREADFEGLDIEGRLAAFLQGTPDREIVSNDFEREKIERALDKGAAGTLLVVRDDPPFLDYVRRLKPYFLKERHYLARSPEEALAAKRRISISAAGAAKLFGRDPAENDAAGEPADAAGDPSGRPRPPTVEVRMVSTHEPGEEISGANVLGYLEGTSKRGECLVLTAHRDHLGKSGSSIFYGAYDNASGVAALLEIAEAFASASRDGRRPARHVVFLAPDAEELGGLGSKFYLEHPLFPLSGVLADINIDGIGREDAERPGLRDFVHLYLSRNGRAGLASVRDRALEWTAPSLRVEPRDNYSGSDHAFFEERLIPAIAFSTGQPRDHHRPTDTPDKLDYRNVRDIARLAFAMAWEIAFGERPIERILSE